MASIEQDMAFSEGTLGSVAEVAEDEDQEAMDLAAIVERTANVSACLNETQAIAELSYEEARTSITAVCAGELLIGIQANSFSKCSAQLAETQTTHNPVAFESQEDLDLGELSAFQEGGVLAFEGAGT